MTRGMDLSVYLVTDRPSCRGRDLLDVVAQAAQGGVNSVQLREKTCDTREFLELGRALKKLLAPLGVPLLINDRVDVALALGCDGVHLGQSDMPCAEARAILGPDAVIGLTIDELSQLAVAERCDVDYLGVGPIFATATKPDAGQPLELEGLEQARRRTRHPIVAIGGIGPDNAEAVVRAGADGVAVVSAVCGAPSPLAAAKALCDAVRRGRI